MRSLHEPIEPITSPLSYLIIIGEDRSYYPKGGQTLDLVYPAIRIVRDLLPDTPTHSVLAADTPRHRTNVHNTVHPTAERTAAEILIRTAPLLRLELDYLAHA